VPSHEVRVVEARRQPLGVGGLPLMHRGRETASCFLNISLALWLHSRQPGRTHRENCPRHYSHLSPSLALSPHPSFHLSLSFSVLFCSISRSLSFFSVFLVIYVSLSLSFCLSTCFVRAVHVSTRWLHGFSRTVERWCRPRWLNTRMIQGVFSFVWCTLLHPVGSMHHLRPRRR